MGYDGFNNQRPPPTLSAEQVGFPTTCVGSTTLASVILHAPDPQEWAGEQVKQSASGEPTYTYDLAIEGDFTLESDSTQTLDEHESAQLAMRFTPSATGLREGELRVLDGDEVVLRATLRGEALAGDGPYWTTGSTLDFGTLGIGESLTGTAVLRIPALDAGTSASLSVTLTGSGFTSSVTGARTVADGGALAIRQAQLMHTFPWIGATNALSNLVGASLNIAGLTGTTKVDLPGINLFSQGGTFIGANFGSVNISGLGGVLMGGLFTHQFAPWGSSFRGWRRVSVGACGPVDLSGLFWAESTSDGPQTFCARAGLLSVKGVEMELGDVAWHGAPRTPPPGAPR